MRADCRECIYYRLNFKYAKHYCVHARSAISEESVDNGLCEYQLLIGTLPYYAYKNIGDIL